MPLLRLFARAGAGAAWNSGGLALGLFTLAGLGQALLVSSVVPRPGLFGQLLLGAAGAVFPLSLAVATLAGVAGGFARLREERALLALASLGVPATRLLPAVVTLSAVMALPYALCTHVLEPRARALLRDARVEAAAAVVPREGRPVRVGTWWLALDGERLVFTDGIHGGLATSWAWRAAAGGVVAELGGVRLDLGDAGAAIKTLTLPIPIEGRGRISPAERTTSELRVQLVRSAALGRDGTERWLLYKRTLLPVALVPLAVAAAGLARRVPAGGVVGGLLFVSWLTVRALDASVPSLGPVAAAALFGLGMMGLAGAAWRK